MASIATLTLGGYPVDAGLVAVTALYLFSMHTMNRCMSFEADRFNEPNRAHFYEKYRGRLLAASGVAGGLSLALGLAWGPSVVAGLAAGIAVYLKQLKPSIKIVAVESEESACFIKAKEAGQPTELDSVGIFADGVAVKVMGQETFRLCNRLVDETLTVTNDEICGAIKDIFDDTRVIAEPAGALSVAAIRKYVKQHNLKGKKLGGILCGANINFHTLRYVSERCELGEQKEAVFAVKIPEKKGAFKQFCECVGAKAITEFNYRYASDSEAHIFVGVKLKGGQQEFATLQTDLATKGYDCFNLTDNELAKLHVRHMVGGRPPTILNEQVFSFEFPERPGALLNFLSTIGEQWNITLFHYRNHGAAEGLVLAGFDIAPDSRDAFNTHVAELGYKVEEVTNDPAYQFFLSQPN